MTDEFIRYVTLPEVKSMLEREEKKREFTYEQKLALQHAKTFAVLTVKKSRELVNRLMKMEKMNELLAYKIADLLPETPDEVRTIFAKERYTLTPEEIEELLAVVKEFRGED